MKVMTIVGTRPELIKLSQVIKELDKQVDHILVHTGQNYDYELNDIFYDELGIRKPDHFMDIHTGNPIDTISGILVGIDDILAKEKPDAVLILGDTNSSLCAYVAKRLKIPIFHMEAGNRCFDARVPEEINRKIVDHLSDINMPYTEHARRNLLAEGLPTDQIIKTGSPMYEIINKHFVDIDSRKAYEKIGLEKHGYYLVSCHREENVDDAERLSELHTIITKLSMDLPVVVSVHPRLKNRIGREYEFWERNDNVILSKPFGFIDYCSLQKNAKCVISDSGTITEESSLLGFPAVTIRQAHERPEGMDEGVLIMSDLNFKDVMNAINVTVLQQPPGRWMGLPPDYKLENVSEKVVRLILSYTDYVNRRVWYK